MLSSRLAPRGRRAPEPEGDPGGRQVQRGDQRGEQRQAVLVLVQLVEDLTHVDHGEHHHHDRDHSEQQPPTGTQPDRDRQRERQRGCERDERRRFEVDTEQRRVLAALLGCLAGARLAVRLLAGRLIRVLLGALCAFLGLRLAALGGLARSGGGCGRLVVAVGGRLLDADADDEADG